MVGIPLLYTMEVWWIGATASTSHVLAALAIAYLPVVALNRTSGFRTSKDVRLSDAMMDAVEALAVGVLSAAGLLVLLREITLQTPVRSALGKIVYEGMPFSLGIVLARHFLSGDADASRPSKETSKRRAGSAGAPSAALSQSTADIGGSLLGAVVIAFAIAPTDEVRAISSALSPLRLILIVVVSLVVSYGIVFEAGFGSQTNRHEHAGIMQSPVSETMISYLVALFAAWAMLQFFDRTPPGTPWFATLSQVVVLGLPAAVGGAAGRLAV